jgi:hypothetical protein
MFGIGRIFTNVWLFAFTLALIATALSLAVIFSMANPK